MWLLLNQSMSPVDFQESFALRLLNRGGKWQNKQILLSFLSTVTTGFQGLVIVFIGFQPKFACVDDIRNWNETEKMMFNDRCSGANFTANVSSRCSGGYVYDVDKHESIVSEWDLVCDKAFFSETSQLLFTVGLGVGSAIVPPLSDRLGRRWTIILLRIALLLCSFGLVLVPSITWFMVLRFLSGAVSMANTVVRYVFLIEMCPVKLRPLIGNLDGVVWASTLCLQSLIAHLLRGVSWRTFQAVASIPTLTAILDLILVKESILWLYANNRRTEASALVEEALRVNRLTQDSFSPVNDLTDVDKEALPGYIHQSEEADALETEQPSTKQVSIIDLIKTKTTRRIVPIISITWLTNSLVYYGIYMMSYAMPGDRILNVFLNAAVEMPSFLALYISLRFFSRRITMVGFHGLCAISLLLGGIFAATLKDHTKYVLTQVVTFVGKFGISATFTCIYVYTTEVFPTNFRSSGLGIGSLSARFGSLLSSYAGVFARELPWGPGVIFGTLCLVVTILLLWAPETKNKALPQTLEDMGTIAAKKTKHTSYEMNDKYLQTDG